MKFAALNIIAGLSLASNLEAQGAPYHDQHTQVVYVEPGEVVYDWASIIA